MRFTLLPILFLLLALFSCNEDTPAGSTNQEENIATDNDITKPESLDTLFYGAIGASDAVGVGAENYSDGYVYLINDTLQTFVTSLRFENYGISGLTIDSILTNELPQVLLDKPTLITIWTGGNDFLDIMHDEMTLDQFERGVDSLLKSLSTNLPNADVIIADIPDMTKLPIFDEYDAIVKQIGKVRIDSINAIIERNAVEYSTHFFELDPDGSFITNSANISANDGFHPSTAGYKVMAEKYIKAIYAALN